MTSGLIPYEHIVQDPRTLPFLIDFISKSISNAASSASECNPSVEIFFWIEIEEFKSLSASKPHSVLFSTALSIFKKYLIHSSFHDFQSDNKQQINLSDIKNANSSLSTGHSSNNSIGSEASSSALFNSLDPQSIVYSHLLTQARLVRSRILQNFVSVDMFTVAQALIERDIKTRFYEKFIQSYSFRSLTNDLRQRKTFSFNDMLLNHLQTRFFQAYLVKNAPQTLGCLMFLVDIVNRYRPMASLLSIKDDAPSNETKSIQKNLRSAAVSLTSLPSVTLPTLPSINTFQSHYHSSTAQNTGFKQSFLLPSPMASHASASASSSMFVSSPSVSSVSAGQISRDSNLQNPLPSLKTAPKRDQIAAKFELANEMVVAAHELVDTYLNQKSKTFAVYASANSIAKVNSDLDTIKTRLSSPGFRIGGSAADSKQNAVSMLTALSEIIDSLREIFAPAENDVIGTFSANDYSKFCDSDYFIALSLDIEHSHSTINREYEKMKNILGGRDKTNAGKYIILEIAKPSLESLEDIERRVIPNGLLSSSIYDHVYYQSKGFKVSVDNPIISHVITFDTELMDPDENKDVDSLGQVATGSALGWKFRSQAKEIHELFENVDGFSFKNIDDESDDENDNDDEDGGTDSPDNANALSQSQEQQKQQKQSEAASDNNNNNSSTSTPARPTSASRIPSSIRIRSKSRSLMDTGQLSNTNLHVFCSPLGISARVLPILSTIQGIGGNISQDPQSTNQSGSLRPISRKSMLLRSTSTAILASAMAAKEKQTQPPPSSIHCFVLPCRGSNHPSRCSDQCTCLFGACITKYLPKLLPIPDDPELSANSPGYWLERKRRNQEYKELTVAIDKIPDFGLGLSLALSRGSIFVNKLVPHPSMQTSAEKSGIQVGDELQAVNGSLVFGRPFQEVVAQIKAANTPIIFTFSRGIRPQEITQEGAQEKASDSTNSSKHRKVYLPQSVCILSSFPLFDRMREMLVDTYNDSYWSNRDETHPVSEAFLKKYIRQENEKRRNSLIVTQRRSPRSKSNIDRPMAPRFPFRILFDTLSLENILSILSSLLLGGRVLFCSDQMSRLCLVSECLFSLLWPFSWLHFYCPVLPQSLVSAFIRKCENGKPFMVGICTLDLCPCEEISSKKFSSNAKGDNDKQAKGKIFEESLKAWNGQDTDYWTPYERLVRSGAVRKLYDEGVMIIDIDSDMIYHSNHSARTIPFPDDIKDSLLTSIHDILSAQLYKHLEMPIMKTNTTGIESDDEYNTDLFCKVHSLLLKAFTSMIGSYTEHFEILGERDANAKTSLLAFNSFQFLNACKEEHRSFVRVFIQTQGFASLLRNRWEFFCSDDSELEEQ